MNNTWHNLYITDKYGNKYFNTDASPMSTMSEIRNLTQHIKRARKFPEHYKFLDVHTARIMLDGEVYGETATLNDIEDIIKELES